ncbi:MAG: SxtJ family membrane protein [bacterium]
MSFITEIFEEINKLQQDKKALRKFGLTMAPAFFVLGLLIFFLGSKPEKAFWLWGIAVIFLTSGLIAPKILKGIYKIWMGLALLIGWVMSRVILSLLYYLAITPIAFFMRLIGKDLLDQKIDKNISSYWTVRENQEINIQKYEKLF